jgi:hypothetical protein
MYQDGRTREEAGFSRAEKELPIWKQSWTIGTEVIIEE